MSSIFFLPKTQIDYSLNSENVMYLKIILSINYENRICLNTEFQKVKMLQS